MMVGQDEEHIAHRETPCLCNVCAHGGAGPACEWEEAKFTKPGADFDECLTCQSPLCVCMDKVQKLRDFYLLKGRILLVPGN